MKRRSVLIVALLSGLISIVADAQAPVASRPSASSTTEDSSDRWLAPRGLSGLREEARSSNSAGLAAFDATGMPVQRWLESQSERLPVRVAETEAEYRIVTDQSVQLADLTASDGRTWDELGWGVAVSGNTVVAGAPGVTLGREATGDEGGAAYVFVMPPNGWASMTQVAKLTPLDYVYDDGGGWSVAIDGNTVVVGAPSAIQGIVPGWVDVFVMPPGGWADMTETARLTPSDGAMLDYFGYSVSISGNTVVVGAPYSPAYSSLGAAYVFVEPPDGWTDMTETAKLTPSDGATGLGGSVSISGNTVVAGAKSPGAAYVFVEPPNGWVNMTQTAKLTSSDRVKTAVVSVAIDGNTVVAGRPSGKIGGNKQQGEAYVFVSPATGWANMTQTAILTASDGAAGDHFGFSASISDNTVMIGAPLATVGGNPRQGAAYEFVMPSSGWTNTAETTKLTASDGNVGGGLGHSVAINGDTVVAGAPECSVAHHVGRGAAYVF
jgi:hypothetical protein